MVTFLFSCRNIFYEAGKYRNIINPLTPNDLYIYIYTNFNIHIYTGVPGGMCNTSGGCSLGQTIPI